jgi:hypothetical protein
MLDRILGHEIDRRHRPPLPFAPDADDALFELGWVPWQVKIDDAAREYQVSDESPAIRSANAQRNYIGVVR